MEGFLKRIFHDHTGMVINAGDALIYDDIYSRKGKKQFFINDPVYNIVDESFFYYLTVHRNSISRSGWFKKKDVKIIDTCEDDKTRWCV